MNDTTNFDGAIRKAFFAYKNSVKGTPKGDSVSVNSFIAGWLAAEAAIAAATKK